MKIMNSIKIKSILAGVCALLMGGTTLTSCQDDFDRPDIDVPVASIKPNTTIAELKARYWSDDTNFASQIEAKEDGSRVIIHGYVISTDEPGNVFKSLVIQDESGALAMSINSYNLYLKYRRGQEVVLDVTGMYIGKYAGLMQLGMPSWYENGNSWQVSFMAPEYFSEKVQLNGVPDVSKIDTLVVNSFDEMAASPEGLRYWQSRLVRFNNVEFQNGGTETFSEYHSSGVSQNILDANGNSLAVRTSGYSNFWNKTLPEGRGDVVALVGYFNTAWQLTLIDYEGCMNFGNPTMASGTENNPYTVEEAIAVQKGGASVNGWVSGYIVGAVAPEVTTVADDKDVEWTSEVSLANTLVIGATADTRSIANALVITLPSGSALRNLGNLRDNPDNYRKAIKVKGTMTSVMGTYGVADNNGTSAEFSIEGVSTGDEAVPNGDGTAASPYNSTQVLNGSASGTSAYVRGYIVGFIPDKYLNEAKFELPATVQTNVLIADTPGETDYNKCTPLQLPAGSVRSGVNLQDNPGNMGALLTVVGSIEKYFGVMGVKAITEYSIDGAGDTPVTPVEAVSSIDENFESGSLPAGWTQAQVAGNKSWYVTSFSNNYYAAMTGYKGTAPFDQWLITPAVDMSKVTDKTLTFDNQVNGYGSTTTVFEVYVMTTADPATATLTKLSPALATAPASGYSSFVNSGKLNLSSFSGTIYIGFRYKATQDANYATWCVDNIKLNATGGENPPTPPTPPTPGEYKGDFNSFNGGSPKATPYGTYTNATGWSAENAIILSGSSDGTDNNPKFAFIGTDATLAPCILGRTDKVGKIVSPVLTGGIKTLTFSYGLPFADKAIKFTVNIKQGGTVVKTQTVDLASATQKQAYSFSMDVNVSGDFTIEIVNDCPGNASGKNADRVAFWNLTWN